MVFNFHSLLPARRSVSLPGVSMPVLDTNTLREAALRASWQRDQRVARRRLAIRWALWWIWKFRARLLAACAALIALVALLYYLGVIGPWMVDAPPAAPHTDSSLQLRLERELQDRSTLPAKRLPPADVPPANVPTPVQLKPEIQLKIKESSP